MSAKSFDAELNKEYDGPARKALKDHFKFYNKGPLVDDPDGPMKCDLADPKGVRHEVEVKDGWWQQKYPFADVRITYRKHNKTWDWCWVFNKTLDKAALVSRKAYDESPIIKEYVNDRNGGKLLDEFKVVPLEKIRWVRVETPDQWPLDFEIEHKLPMPPPVPGRDWEETL